MRFVNEMRLPTSSRIFYANNTGSNHQLRRNNNIMPMMSRHFRRPTITIITLCYLVLRFVGVMLPFFLPALLFRRWGLTMIQLPYHETEARKPGMVGEEQLRHQYRLLLPSLLSEPLSKHNGNSVVGAAPITPPSAIHRNSYSPDKTESNHSFYRWGTARKNDAPTESGVAIEPLQHYLEHLSSPHGHSDYGFTYGPVVAYIDANATLLWDMTIFARRQGNVRERLGIIAPFWYDALQQHQHDILVSPPVQSEVPYLTRALQEGGMLPLIFDVMDYTGCLYQNYNYTHRRPSGRTNETVVTAASIPMLTLSSSPTCDYAFPIPSYTTVSLAMQNPETKDWDAAFRQRDARYPWHTKQRKAFWRGAPNGMAKWKTSILEIPRVYVNLLAQNHTDIMDVAVPCYNICRQQRPFQPWIILGDFIPMEDFQKYRAVLDLDGNSWSERFPKLLCQNSVVIKLDPEQIDYFWPTLQAGVHFMAANLSNLVSVVEYAIADAHQDEMQSIVANAGDWCRQRMVVKQIQWDILKLLNGYAKELYRADGRWPRQLSPLGNLTLIGNPFRQ